jgi:hypothetical protein
LSPARVVRESQIFPSTGSGVVVMGSFSVCFFLFLFGEDIRPLFSAGKEVLSPPLFFFSQKVFLSPPAEDPKEAPREVPVI